MILSVAPFGNSWGNSYTKFAILDIKLRLTCVESDLYENIVKFQNIMSKILGYSLLEKCHFLKSDKKIMCYLSVMVIQKVKCFRLKTENIGQRKKNWKFHVFLQSQQRSYYNEVEEECREFSFCLTVFIRVTNNAYY